MSVVTSFLSGRADLGPQPQSVLKARPAPRQDQISTLSSLPFVCPAGCSDRVPLCRRIATSSAVSLSDSRRRVGRGDKADPMSGMWSRSSGPHDSLSFCHQCHSLCATASTYHAGLLWQMLLRYWNSDKPLVLIKVWCLSKKQKQISRFYMLPLMAVYIS